MFKFKEKHQDGVEYHVKVENMNAGDFALTFNTRDAARKYKKALKASTSKLQAYIIKRTYEDGFIAEEKEVS